MKLTAADPAASFAIHTGTCRGAGAPNRFANPLRYTPEVTGCSSVTCHKPLRFASATVTNALAASSTWTNCQIASPFPRMGSLRATSCSPK